jgi:small subunit ribosomal protein S21
MEKEQTSVADAEAQPEIRVEPERTDRRAGEERRPESFEQMLRRFKKSVDNAGILKEVRARSYFESKSQKARRKAAKAARRRSRNKSRSGEQ